MIVQTAELFELMAVDQDGSQYELLARAMEEAGFRLRHACDGQQALQMNSASPVRLWLANMHLPDSSGIELLKILRAKRPAIPFYLLSDEYSVADELAARSSGATGYLSKPVNETWVELCLAALTRRTVRAGPKFPALKPHVTKRITQFQHKPLT